MVIIHIPVRHLLEHKFSGEIPSTYPSFPPYPSLQLFPHLFWPWSYPIKLSNYLNMGIFFSFYHKPSHKRLSLIVSKIQITAFGLAILFVINLVSTKSTLEKHRRGRDHESQTLNVACRYLLHQSHRLEPIRIHPEGDDGDNHRQLPAPDVRNHFVALWVRKHPQPINS